MKKIPYIITALFFVVNVAGCVPVTTQFQCKAAHGEPCRSLDKINRMVTRGEIGAQKPKHLQKLTVWIAPLAEGKKHVHDQSHANQTSTQRTKKIKQAKN